MIILNRFLKKSNSAKELRLQYGEDLADGLIRKQVEELRVQLDPKVYRVKGTKEAKS